MPPHARVGWRRHRGLGYAAGAVVGAGRTVELVGLNELVRQACERSSPSLPPRTKITTDFTEDAALSPDSAIVRELLGS